jgi:response regulator RpfG family c-di-GMP phosphodiesterase
MSVVLKYILVDDDNFSNLISTMIIEDALETVEITAFTEPEKGLEFIKKTYTKNSDHTILFLDINMPMINGWEFLDQYEKFSEEVKMHINIYMLSSSVDHRDKNKADANPYVKGFISKPLDFEIVTSISEREF